MPPQLCPECKFPNLPAARTCLTCKAPLGEEPSSEGSAAWDRAATRELTRPVDPETVPFSPTGGLPARAEGAMGSPSPLPPVPPGAPLLGWLCSPPLPAVPVGPQPEVRVGRSRSCDLILPHPSVSRLHGVLEVDADGLRYEDRSTAGTFFGGQRVHRVELRVGDRLRIGPYEIRLEPADLSQGDEDQPTPTHAFDLSAWRSSADGAQLVGKLEPGALHEVLQGIEFHGKTGTLRITGSRAGVLAVRDGRPLFARLGGLLDAEAVRAMVRLERGDFSFSRELAEGEPRMDTTLTALILDALRERDEQAERR